MNRKNLVRWGLIFTHLARESLHLWPSESERFSPRFRGAKLLAPPHGFAEAAAGNGKHKYYAGNFAGKASLKMFSCNLQFMKKLFNQKGNGCYKFSKKSHECTKMPKKDGKNGVHFMAQCQVIADYKELVGTCADIPQSLELSCIIWRHRAAWQYTNLVTQMVPKPSPLRCGMFGKGTKSVRGNWKERSKQKRGHINR